MGITLTHKQMTDMEHAMIEYTPTISPYADPTDAPKIVSVVGGGSTFGLLLSVRLSDGAVRTMMCNPVVAQALIQLFHVANQERRWWRDDGVPGDMPFSEEELSVMTKAVMDNMPPVPRMAEYQNAAHVVSLFGGSNALGLLLNLRLDSGDMISWFLSPIVVLHLFTITSKCAERADWWDETGEFILAKPDA